jgi:transposase
MIKAMIAGQRDPEVLAGLARRSMKAKHDDLIQALDGMFDDHHGELAGLLLDQIASLDAKIAQLAVRGAELTAAMPGTWGIDTDGTTGPAAGTGPDAPVLNAVTRLAEIPGLSPDLARSIIAETGLDMSRFPTAAHLVSWAGLCPSARQSGPRTRAGKKGQGDTWLRGSLGQAAIGAGRTATFLGERYARIARRRGKAKAQVAGPITTPGPGPLPRAHFSLVISGQCVPECLWMRSSASGRSGRGSAAMMVQVPVRRVAIVRLWTTGGVSALRSASCRAACIPCGRR